VWNLALLCIAFNLCTVAASSLALLSAPGVAAASYDDAAAVSVEDVATDVVVAALFVDVASFPLAHGYCGAFQGYIPLSGIFK